MPKLRTALALLGAAVLTAGCGDDPFRVPWPGIAEEDVIYSLHRDELTHPSAYHMREKRAVFVESPVAGGRWDFALDRDGDGLVLLPPQVLGVRSRAGIAVVPGTSFDDVLEAPRDSLAYVTNEPVPVELGNVYVVRTHEQSGFFGQFCAFFGKLEPVEVDVEGGVLRFVHDTNPECQSRRLVPRGQ